MKELLKIIERHLENMSKSELPGVLNIFVNKGHIQVGTPVISESYNSTFDLKDYPEEEK